MSVSRRIVLSVGVLMLLALGALGSQLWIVMRMQKITNDLSSVSFEAASTLLQMQQQAAQIRRLSELALTLSRAENRQDIEDNLRIVTQNFEDLFTSLRSALQNRGAVGEIALLSASWIDYQTQMDRARSLTPERGLADLPLELVTAIQRLESRTDSSREAVLRDIRHQVQGNQTIGKQAESISIAAAALFLLFGGTITFLTLRAINAPLRELTRGTRTIASGEFSHRLPEDGPSEFAELARDFNSMTEKLEELDQMKRDFVAHVSHELKAPLAAIRQTLAVTIEQIPGPINDGQRRLLELSRNSAERLSAMVSNLLDVSRLEAGTMEYEMSSQDIVGIVRQVVEEFSLKAKDRRIEIAVESDAAGIPVVCDADRMIQVIGNLVDNALKFSPVNSTIRVQVSHNDSSTAPTARVSIADRGAGVPDDHKQNVFQKFHQVKGGGRRTAGQGVGLGLAICRTIMEAHRGRIWVEDNPEGGSVFIVEMQAAAPIGEAAKCG
jgi:two-component system sensor histidine kinase GlrK